MSSGAITLQCPECGGMFLTLQHGGQTEICPHCAVSGPRSNFRKVTEVGQRERAELPGTPKKAETQTASSGSAFAGARSQVLDSPFPLAPEAFMSATPASEKPNPEKAVTPPSDSPTPAAASASPPAPPYQIPAVPPLPAFKEPAYVNGKGHSIEETALSPSNRSEPSRQEDVLPVSEFPNGKTYATPLTEKASGPQWPGLDMDTVASQVEDPLPPLPALDLPPEPAPKKPVEIPSREGITTQAPSGDHPKSTTKPKKKNAWVPYALTAGLVLAGGWAAWKKWESGRGSADLAHNTAAAQPSLKTHVPATLSSPAPTLPPKGTSPQQATGNLANTGHPAMTSPTVKPLPPASPTTASDNPKPSVEPPKVVSSQVTPAPAPVPTTVTPPLTPPAPSKSAPPIISQTKPPSPAAAASNPPQATVAPSPSPSVQPEHSEVRAAASPSVVDGSPADVEVAAPKIVAALNAATTLDARLALIANPDRHRSDVAEYVKSHPNSFGASAPEASSGSVVVLPGGRDAKVFRMITPRCPEGALLYFHTDKGKILLDWPLLKQSHDKTYDAFTAKAGTTAAPEWFTALCRRTHATALKGFNKDRWISLDAQGSLSPAGSVVVYVDKTSPVGRYTEDHLTWDRIYLLDIQLGKKNLEGQSVNVVLDCGAMHPEANSSKTAK